MQTVELMEQALETASQLGYGVRHEYLGGSGGGSCEFNGRKWIFVDLALNVDEQLDQVAEALRSDAGIDLLPLTPDLRRYLQPPEAA